MRCSSQENERLTVIDGVCVCSGVCSISLVVSCVPTFSLRQTAWSKYGVDGSPCSDLTQSQHKKGIQLASSMHTISDFVISVDRLFTTRLIMEVSGILGNPNT